MFEASIVVALIALLGTIIIAILNREKYRKSDAVKLESRLTSIERTLETKLEPIWDCIMKELPKILISPHTPGLDRLLIRASSVGFKNLPEIEAFELYNRLDEAHALEGDKMKRIVVSLVKVALTTENTFSR